MSAAIAPREAAPLYCSFCAKSQHEVDKLVAGPGVFICDGCVGACVAWIEGPPDAGGHAARLGLPETWPNDTHLRLLRAREASAEAARAALQRTVDILRAREVSWAAIGAALGVSRQAAWERFG